MLVWAAMKWRKRFGTVEGGGTWDYGPWSITHEAPASDARWLARLGSKLVGVLEWAEPNYDQDFQVF